MSRCKLHLVLTRTFEVCPVLDWLAALTAHMPNQGEHLAINKSSYDRSLYIERAVCESSP